MHPLPLSGQSILVTRPKPQAKELVQRLTELGAQVWTQPAIEIRPPEDWSPIDSAIGRIEQFGWLVFVSVNGVRFFLQRCVQWEIDLGQFKHLKIAAGGDRTASAIEEAGLSVAMIPENFDSRNMAKALVQHANDKSILLVRANRGSPIIAETLSANQISFEMIAVYENTSVTAADPEIAEKLAAGDFDWVTVTSSAIAKSLANLFGESLKQTQLVAISPTTAAVLEKLGYPPTATARQYNMAGVIEAIVENSPD